MAGPSTLRPFEHQPVDYSAYGLGQTGMQKWLQLAFFYDNYLDAAPWTAEQLPQGMRWGGSGADQGEAIELIDSNLLSRALEGGEASPNIRLLHIFDSAQRLETVISALIETNDMGRKSLFEKLKSRDQILEIIAKSQAKKPIEAYQKYVAAPQFLPTLPESARQCCQCDKKYEVWQHLEVRDCLRHTIHIGCIGYCVCNDKGSVDKTKSAAPSTISSEVVPPFDMAQQLSAVQDLLRSRGIDPPAMAQ
ncbi:hypothetical protein PG991_009240 [Apiospora marii]|uniref:DUF262 domain-containing protein n=1 Tax=Apiospora marii TaxID=335849 RepID=A0ABR1RK28_9PEZI